MARDMVTYGVLAVLIFLAVAVVSPDTLKSLGLSVGSTATVTTDGDTTAAGDLISGKICPDSSVLMTVGKVQERFNPSVDVSTQNHRLYTKENGGVWVDQGLFKDGTTKSVKVNSEFVVVYAENATNSSYYASPVRGKVPCGAFSTAELDDPVKLESYLYAMNSQPTSWVTIRVYNTDDGDLNTASNAQPLTNNDKKTIKMELEGSSEDALSPYGDLIVVIEGNKSNYDKFVLNDGSGAAYSTTSIPPQHVINHTNNRQVAYKIPGGLINNQLITGSLRVEVANADPTNTGEGNNITVSIYDEDFFRDTDGTVNDGSGKFGDLLKGTTMFFGTADNDNNDVGAFREQGGKKELVIVVS